MADAESIKVEMFDKPSGSVRGLVVAFATIKGKQKRIAHATILVDKQPTIALEIPRGVPVGDIPALAGILNEFAARVVKVSSEEQWEVVGASGRSLFAGTKGDCDAWVAAGNVGGTYSIERKVF